MSAPLESHAPTRNRPFSECLRSAREEAGWTQEELAERAGLSANAISALERGERRFPHFSTVRALADALGMAADERAALFAVVPSRRDNAANKRGLSAAVPHRRDQLVGRDHHLAGVGSLLTDQDVALVTIIGPPGVGKTRLAQALAADLESHYRDGAIFIPLAPARESSHVDSAIASALGLQMRDGSAPMEAIIRLLREHHRLLILDNFEHVLDTSRLVADIARDCPNVSIVVTSREVLHIGGEHVFRLPPLELPEPKEEQDAGQIAASPAVHLFSVRARAALPEFMVTDANAGAVATLCRRLDGLPLAIELAASRIAVLSPEAMVNRLDRRLSVLASGSRDAPDRHQSLTAAIAWSYDLLTAEEQSLFRQLSVFVGGFTLDAAEAVAAADEVLTGIASLVDKSLVRRVETGGDESRFDMLETIREFGTARVDAHGESHETRLRHIEYFVALAEDLSVGLEWDPNPDSAHRRLNEEHGNFEAALAWASETGEKLPFSRLATALPKYWADSGRFREGLGWLEHSNASASEVPEALRAAIMRSIAWLSRCLGESDRAWEFGEASLELARGLNDILGTVDSLSLLAFVAEDRGDFALARTLCAEALELARPLKHPFWTGIALDRAAWATFLAGDVDQAEMLLGEALELTDSPYVRALTLSDLANVFRARGDFHRAVEHWQARLSLRSDAWSFRWCLEGLADLAVDLGEMERATRLLGASEVHRERIGVALVPSRVKEYESSAAAACAALGNEAFNAAWQEGRLMSEDEARAEAARVGQ